MPQLDGTGCRRVPLFVTTATFLDHARDGVADRNRVVGGFVTKPVRRNQKIDPTRGYFDRHHNDAAFAGSATSTFVSRHQAD